MKKYQKPYSMSIIDFEKPNEYGIIPAVAAAIAPFALATVVGTTASTVGGAALAAAAAGVVRGVARGLVSSSGRKNVFNNPLDSLNPIKNI